MNRIKDLRLEKKMTLEDLAIKLNTTKSNISMIEREERGLNEESIKSFSNYFNVSTDYLLGLSDIRNPRMTQFGKYEHEIEELLGDDPNLLQTFKDLMKREECALLFSKVKELDASTIKKVLGIINIIEKEESD